METTFEGLGFRVNIRVILIMERKWKLQGLYRVI